MCALQVSFRTSVQRQSFTVEVCVIDKNDNVPTFIEESMRGSVQLGLLKGTRTLSSDVIVSHRPATWNTKTLGNMPNGNALKSINLPLTSVFIELMKLQTG